MLSSSYPGPPYSADPMNDALRDSMVPVTIVAIISFISTGCLILYLLLSYAQARQMHTEFSPQYQNAILIFNLLLGDFTQSLGFSMDSTWILQRKVVLGAICDLQGTLIQTGDMLGSLFVTSIAVHTFIYVVLKRRVCKTAFFVWVAAAWMMSLFTGIGAPVIKNAYTPGTPHYWTLAGSWCWIRIDYAAERLWTHYIFIFFDQIVCIVIYLTIYIKLVVVSRKGRERIRTSSNGKVEKAARLMIIYPLAYIFCTLPLASIRMHTMLGGNPSLHISSVFGAIFASSGIVNSLLYGITRNLTRKQNPRKPHTHPRNFQSSDEYELRRPSSDAYKVTATVNSIAEDSSKDKCRNLSEQKLGFSFFDRGQSTPSKSIGPIHIRSETFMRTEAIAARFGKDGPMSSNHNGRETIQLLDLSPTKETDEQLH